MRVQLTRDSVCLGDDCDAPHERWVEIESPTTVEAVVSAATEGDYLPRISGGRATWILESELPPDGPNCAPGRLTDGPFKFRIPSGRVLAVFAQQWAEPRWFVDPEMPINSAADLGHALFFRYWCQRDPDLVADCLRDGRELPDMYGVDAAPQQG